MSSLVILYIAANSTSYVILVKCIIAIHSIWESLKGVKAQVGDSFD